MKKISIFLLSFVGLLSAGSDRWVGHVTSVDGGFGTVILAKNNNSEFTVLHLQPYTIDGNELTQRRIELNGSECKSFEPDILFQNEAVSHFSITSEDRNGYDCHITVVYRASVQNSGSAHVQETSEIGTRFQLFTGETPQLWDGMALVNVSDQTCDVTVIKINSLGNETFRQTIGPITPKAKLLHVFDFEVKSDELVIIETSKDVIATFLRGSKDKTILFANPAIRLTDPMYRPTVGLYDDFDGHGCTQGFLGADFAATRLNPTIWKQLTFKNFDSIEIVQDQENNHVVKLASGYNSAPQLVMTNLEDFSFEQLTEFSTDMMISSETVFESGRVAAIWFQVKLWSTDPVAETDSCFGPAISLVYGEGRLYAEASFSHDKTELSVSNVTPIELDHWYRAVMKFIKLSDTELRIDYYLDDTLLLQHCSSISEVLLDRTRLKYDPTRYLVAFSDYGGKTVGYFDNIKADYGLRLK